MIMTLASCAATLQRNTCEQGILPWRGTRAKSSSWERHVIMPPGFPQIHTYPQPKQAPSFQTPLPPLSAGYLQNRDGTANPHPLQEKHHAGVSDLAYAPES